MADRIKNYQQEADQITTLKAIRTDLSVTPSSYTPDATVVTKDRVVTFAQAEEELVVLSDIEKGVKQQVVKGDIADKRITNIEKLLQGNLYDYQTDTTSAYTKSVPSGAMPYAGIEKIGGKTVVMNQYATEINATNYKLWNTSLTSATFNDGVITVTVNDASDSNAYRYGTYSTNTIFLTIGHKYYYHYDVQCSSVNTVIGSQIVNISGDVTISSANTWQRVSNVATASQNTQRIFLIYPNNNIAVGMTYSIKNLMLFDITLMFGAGNEPTPQQFESIFPASYYPYNAGTLLSAGVTEVVSKDSNNETLQTISIPTAIRNLEGYGWSAGSVYNEIDFERKVFIKRVARVVLDGTQTISGSNWSPSADGVGWYYPYALTNNKITGSEETTPNVVTNKYIARRYDELVYKEEGIGFVADGSFGLIIWQTDTTLNNATAINNYLSANPITVYYELATPVENDISQYLTNDNLIEVEADGTLTFPNQNGDDYRLPVPSEETYMIDLQEAINNG